MLEIYAGKNALTTIQEHGFKEELFTHFLGASGGPKWFMLFGLDKYLFGDFFKDRGEELNLIGSSAGAFRAACLAQNNPVNAITNLAYKYANTSYSDKPTAQEISNSAKEIVEALFTGDAASEVISNKVFKAHFIVAKCQGLTASDNKLLQGAGLLSSILLNKIDRKLLTNQYQRYIFRNPSSKLSINDPYQFHNTYQDLTIDNIKDALLASGSIPMVMSKVSNIAGANKGAYRDGGIIDYHFDLSLTNSSTKEEELAEVTEVSKNNIKITSPFKAKNLVLYPHFSNTVKAGWFDKNSQRKVLDKSYENTVLLAPSQKFINSLPYKKIPDRTDFTTMDADTRIKYWEKVLTETDRMAEDFNDFIVRQDIKKIRKFQP